MCAACFCPCISQSRATPLERSRFQTSEILNRSSQPIRLRVQRVDENPACHVKQKTSFFFVRLPEISKLFPGHTGEQPRNLGVTDIPGYDRRCTKQPRKAIRGGISKVDFQETLSIFGDKCPQNGSKNDPMAPRTTLECPHEGPSVVKDQHVLLARQACCSTDTAHTTQSRPDSGPGLSHFPGQGRYKKVRFPSH